MGTIEDKIFREPVNKRTVIFFLIFLILANTLCHFLPFERASLAPDSYAALLKERNIREEGVTYYFLNFPHRPLNYLILDLQSRFAGDSPHINLWLLFFSSIFVLVTAFYLFRALLDSSLLAFLCSLIYCLLPNKLETYHNSIMVNINMVVSFYMLSLLFFIYYLLVNKNRWLLLSLVTYSIGIFWYEAGFFIPLAMCAYAFLVLKRRSLKPLLFFVFPAFVYALLRVSAVFGLGTMKNYSHAAGFSGGLTAMSELFHHLFGRYMARSVIYGFYKFVSIPEPWPILLLILDIVFLVILALWLRGFKPNPVSRRSLIFSGIMFLIFLIPVFINKAGGIGGRHLILSSIGLVIFLLWAILLFKKSWRIVFVFLTSLAMIICQGNAWSQVIACRINAAVYDTLKEKKGELIKADNIVFDIRSFAEKIPFAFVKRDFNLLNTYYGAQAFEDWGLLSMVSLTLDTTDKHIYISKETPKVIDNGLLQLQVSIPEGYRLVSSKQLVIPKKSSLVIDFNNVYPDGFRNGLRKHSGGSLVLDR